MGYPMGWGGHGGWCRGAETGGRGHHRPQTAPGSPLYAVVESGSGAGCCWVSNIRRERRRTQNPPVAPARVVISNKLSRLAPSELLREKY